jgi:hypothetical protein
MDLLKILWPYKSKAIKIKNPDQLLIDLKQELEQYSKTIEQRLLTQYNPKQVHSNIKFDCEVKMLDGYQYLRIQIEFYSNQTKKLLSDTSPFGMTVERFVVSQANIYTPSFLKIIQCSDTRDAVFNQITALIEDVMLMKL